MEHSNLLMFTDNQDLLEPLSKRPVKINRRVLKKIAKHDVKTMT